MRKSFSAYNFLIFSYTLGLFISKMKLHKEVWTSLISLCLYPCTSSSESSYKEYRGSEYNLLEFTILYERTHGLLIQSIDIMGPIASIHWLKRKDLASCDDHHINSLDQQ